MRKGLVWHEYIIKFFLKINLSLGEAIIPAHAYNSNPEPNHLTWKAIIGPVLGWTEFAPDIKNSK